MIKYIFECQIILNGWIIYNININIFYYKNIFQNISKFENLIFCQNLKIRKYFFKISNLKIFFQISKSQQSQNFQNSKSENMFSTFLSTQFLFFCTTNFLFHIFFQKYIWFFFRKNISYFFFDFHLKNIFRRNFEGKLFWALLHFKNQDMWFSSRNVWLWKCWEHCGFLEKSKIEPRTDLSWRKYFF